MIFVELDAEVTSFLFSVYQDKYFKALCPGILSLIFTLTVSVEVMIFLLSLIEIYIILLHPIDYKRHLCHLPYTKHRTNSACVTVSFSVSFVNPLSLDQQHQDQLNHKVTSEVCVNMYKTKLTEALR